MESSSGSDEIKEKCMQDRTETSETVKRKRRKQKAPPATLTPGEVIPRKKKKTLQELETNLHETSEIYQQLVVKHDTKMTLREIITSEAKENTTSEKSSEEISENVLENIKSSPQSLLRASSNISQQFFQEDNITMKHDIQSAWRKEESSGNSPKDKKSSSLQSPVDARPKDFPSPEIDKEMALKDDINIKEHELLSSSVKEERTTEIFFQNLKCSPRQSPVDAFLKGSPPSENYEHAALGDDIKIQMCDVPSSCVKKEGTSDRSPEKSPKNLKSSPPQLPLAAVPKGAFPVEIHQHRVLEDNLEIEEHDLPSSSVKEEKASEEAAGAVSEIVLESNSENLLSSPLSDLEVALQHDIIILPEIPSFRITFERAPERTPERTSENTSLSGSSSRRTPTANSPRTPSTNWSRTPSTNSSRTPSTSSSRTPSTNSSRTPSTNSPRTPSTNSPRTPRVGSPCSCRRRCFDQFSYLEINRLLEMAQGQTDTKDKFEYLSSLMEAKSVKRLRPKTGGGRRRTVACTYSVKLDDKKYTVCKKAFCSLNGVSKRYVHNISERWKYTHLVPRPGLIENATDEDEDSP
ncbi:spermatogenesis-associated protein 31H1-like [Euwallacea fornicatus]|uniref:spermatogenesis-associated protein 31H1-like n=1 Tax=Euwallacea fornicatus TaxID=995702 RepID=UPI00338DA891